MKITVHKKVLISILFLFTQNIFAQKNNPEVIKKMRDSIITNYLEQTALKYPAIRQINLSNEIISRGKVKANLYDNEFLKGDAQIFRNRFNFSMPVVQWNRNSISATIGALYQYFDLTNIQSYNNQVQNDKMHFDRATMDVILGYTRLDSLLGIPVIYHAGISGLFNTSAHTTYLQSRFTYTGLLSFQVKRTAFTSLSLGVIVTIDPASTLPILPWISFYHRFNSTKLELFTDMPSRLSLRKELSKKSFLSLNSDLESNLAFFTIKNNIVPFDDAVYTSIELKTGLLYEYRLSKKLVFGIGGGMLSTYSSKMIKRSESNSNSFIKNDNSPVPYLNISLSFLPFLHGLKLQK